jgi:hypothetical protein
MLKKNQIAYMVYRCLIADKLQQTQFGPWSNWVQKEKMSINLHSNMAKSGQKWQKDPYLCTTTICNILCVDEKQKKIKGFL